MKSKDVDALFKIHKPELRMVMETRKYELLCKPLIKAISDASDVELAEKDRQIGELVEVLELIGVKKDTHRWCRYSHDTDRWPCHSCGVEIAEYREDNIPPSLWEPTKEAKAILAAIAKYKEPK